MFTSGEEMPRNLFVLTLLFCLLATAREGAPIPHTVLAKVGLILVGATQDGLALAADGSSLNADGRVSQEQRLFQLGKNGALALMGTISIQDPIGARVRGELNIARIASSWAAAHPDADPQTADREINSEIAAALNKFLSTRDLGAERGRFKFGVIIAGFNQSKPVLMTTKYSLPVAKDRPARAEKATITLQPGDIWQFGSSAAAIEILTPKKNALKTFKESPAVRKLSSTPRSSLAAQDYINLFDAILRAAESDEGKKRDGRRAIVASPNRFATVAPAGFFWSKADAT